MAQSGKNKPPKEPTFNNSPFKALKTALKKPAAPTPAGRPPPRPETSRTGATEEEMFQLAMSGVAPLADVRGQAVAAPSVRQAQVVSDDAEALARLAELVSGEGTFDFADSDEYVEGSIPGLDQRVLLALRRGEYAVQAHVDLHGMTKADAKEAVDRFLAQARRDDKRCVLIVHGRGLNSKDHIPVLKEQLKVWLQRGRIGKAVLAFATARPHDGGAGALYVLLRR